MAQVQHQQLKVKEVWEGNEWNSNLLKELVGEEISSCIKSKQLWLRKGGTSQFGLLPDPVSLPPSLFGLQFMAMVKVLVGLNGFFTKSLHLPPCV